MSTIVLDLAVAGSWEFRASREGRGQGRAVRLAYGVLGQGGAVSECGALILEPPTGLVVTRENEERGGVTLAGLTAEGVSAAKLLRHPLWRHLEVAREVVTFCGDFHLKAFASFGHAVGVDLDALPRPRFLDAMLGAAPLAKIEWPNPRQNRTGRDRYKNPSLIEAYDAIVGGDLSAKHLEALAQPKPVAAFGVAQVRAIAELHRVMARPVSADRFAMG